MEIRRIIWLEDIAEKLIWKHNVEEQEVIEALENKPTFQFKEKGFQPGEDVYVAFGRTNTGRPLSIFFYTHDNQAIVVSARDMSPKEKRKYVN